MREKERVCALILDFDPDGDRNRYGDIGDIAGEASALARHLQVPLFVAGEEVISGEEIISEEDALYLYWNEEGLSLRGGGLSLRGDFSGKISRLRHHNLTHEMLIKASRFKGREHGAGEESETGRESRAERECGEERPGMAARASGLTAIDATAGMGEDSLLLAAAGFDVTLYEYDPVIAALLRDTLRRACRIFELSDIVKRMHPVEGDSIPALQELETAPDLILLDPMFPEKRRKSLSKEKLQLIQKLERPCPDETKLLDASLAAGAGRVVVKRPLKGPYLAGRKPDYSIKGKTIRYYCYQNTIAAAKPQ